ncbi:hypothetical protein SODALDRAFT_202300 [Sodiomyces alkalinus F11]|uniref:Elongator complex protein 6 n=1 Tax=Sodiomyces alkalinus (strain CBS 110278 / VKM F-3762 / F11) TaxID=1314773 RepID=A0A3N2PT06_SODAK|nr:hypothetical protein SODALDRAFT_202300 [Sodiomyces alkalinus F11]ROT37652.1 hypothetical protein SODALDRAFT_202300 [Sodiomyces alkalinus F11]
MATRIPPLIEPYLGLPPECAHIVLTNVLGATTNWLILRYLYSYLHKKPASAGANSDGNDDPTVNVVLVSFMRDFIFWKEGAGRLGLDLESLARAGRFVFVDGLTGLFTPPPATTRAGPVPNPRGRRTLRSVDLPDVRRELLAAVSDIGAGTGAGSTQGKTVLIIDQPDILLAMMADLDPDPSDGGATTRGQALREALLDVQEAVYASIFAVAADEPLVAAQTTLLEREHAALVLSLAHSALLVLSLRLLDTGGASDVSGVLRATRGGDLEHHHNDGKAVEEAELLYLMATDGSVKVFQRGQ